MTEPTAYAQTLSNILQRVVNSSWSLYRRELLRNAESIYPGGSSIIALHNVAIPRLEQIFNHTNNPNALFAELLAVLDQVSIQYPNRLN